MATKTSLAKFFAQHPAASKVLRAYRSAAKAYLVDAAAADRRGARRKGGKAEALDHWTVVLFNDFAAAGPRSAGPFGFAYSDWSLLQVLRNSGAAFDSSFPAQVDALIDAQA